MSGFKLLIDNRPGTYKDGKTVEFVAGILEQNYGIQKIFRAGFRKEIAKEVLSFFAKRQKSGITSRNESAPEIAKLYQQAITKAWFDGKGTGGFPIPTKAALERRRKRGKGTKGGRSTPSFVDTGLFRRTIRARFLPK